jgi:iron complex outermembrane receptor protein
MAGFASVILAAAANAQTPQELPPINVDATRLNVRPVTPAPPSDGADKPIPVTAPGTEGGGATNTAPVNAAIADNGIVGASTTVISREEIARSPYQTIQEIIATAPGVQVQTLFGGVNGAQTSVDVRGFGAFAAPNTLILLNGRRLNEADLQGVDLSTIPLQSIERIEITRGNSGAVLYGDNAVGGVVNIVTKTGAGAGKPVALRVEGGVGSYGQKEGNVSASVNSGPWSSAAFGNLVQSDGYRANNALDQHNGIGDLRYSTPDFSAFLNVTGDDQSLGLPGGRSTRYILNLAPPSSAVNQLVTDPRGTSTPLDYGKKQGNSVTSGFTKSLWNGAELIVDGGYRQKKQQAGFFGDPADPFFPFASYVDSNLETYSITPRLRLKTDLFGLPSDILTGIDYYDSTYHSSRSALMTDPPSHIYDVSQQTLASYFQQTIALRPSTDFSYGARIQDTRVKARDTYDPNAPFVNLGAQATPLDQDETNHALHVGLEHRLNDTFTVFGRAAQAFRTPNVDERVITGVAFDPVTFAAIPQNFQLKTQTSYDAEGGFKIHRAAFDLQTSYYDMHLKNEIHYNPVQLFNYNLDPTHRYGTETALTVRASETLRFKGSFAYTRAVYEEGPFKGNDVPLVSKLSGSAGVSWDVWQRYLVFDATARFWSARRFDNDQVNFQPLIPGNTTVDLKLSGAIDHFFWSAGINNLFNVSYYDYGIASATLTNVGVFNAYPLPGRTYLLRAGMTF